MTNPLLESAPLPAFDRIQVRHIEPAIDSLLEGNREALDSLLSGNTPCTWETLLQPLQENEDRLNRAWSPITHLHAVADNEELREAYNACLPKLTNYATEMGQNADLYRACKQIAESDGYERLNHAQRKIIDNALRDFRLSGIDLDHAKQQRFREIQQQLSQLQTKFEENLLDATHAWSKHIEDVERLKGLPESTLALAAQTARHDNREGWLLTLDFPCYAPVMQYAEDRELRREMYTAYVTRASDQGAEAGKWDNSEIMLAIITLRKEMAELLGFDSYAGYSLARKMAGSPAEVLDFLEDLGRRSRPVADAEFAELKSFAREHFQANDLCAWDIAFYSEKLSQHRFHFSQEDLRPYFPALRVVEGMFTVVRQLYGLSIKERGGVACWHPDVRFFEIHDADQELRGSFYLDLYARPHKRGGAWMDECIVRKKYNGTLQKPVAFLTCNFTPPVDGAPSLLTHEEVQTLFHEFGHGLHHMLTLVDYPAVSGINGVPWDAVELPSQFMENWCWERESLDMVAAHYQNGSPLPDSLFDKMHEAKTFQSGMRMARQLEFALFDFHLHHDAQVESSAQIQQLIDTIRARIAVVIPPAYNRFQHGFAHIFAGGYAAGYYSYKWAEVLSADAFSKFRENGIFDKKTGQHFMQSILEQGGSRDPMELFIEFRGRKPSIEPLLRDSG